MEGKTKEVMRDEATSKLEDLWEIHKQLGLKLWDLEELLIALAVVEER